MVPLGKFSQTVLGTLECTCDDIFLSHERLIQVSQFCQNTKISVFQRFSNCSLNIAHLHIFGLLFKSFFSVNVMINVGLAKVSFLKLKSDKSCPGKPGGGGGCHPSPLLQEVLILNFLALLY